MSCLSKIQKFGEARPSFNNLTDLQGLKSCVNLKWLSVVENKLQSLNGIEGLTKLTVLNAGKNKLKSMNEISSLVNLQVLIMNGEFYDTNQGGHSDVYIADPSSLPEVYRSSLLRERVVFLASGNT